MYEYLSSLVGIPHDQIKVLVCLYMIFPLGFINYYLTSPVIRLVYGLVSGILLSYYMYGFEIYHLFIDALVTYFYLKFFGRKKSAFFVLIFTISHLSFSHIKRMLNDYGGWSMDVSGLYMMLVVKFSAFAFSYEDGGKNEEDLKNDYMREKRIRDFPTFLEFISFIFHFSSCIVGPSIEFIDFKKFIYLQDEYQNIPFSKVVLFCLKRTGVFILYSSTYVIGNIYFPIDYLTTEEFGYRSIFYKIIFVYFAGLVIKVKYYTGWTLGHNAMSFSGLTYSNIPKKHHKLTEGEIKEGYHSFDKAECVGFSVFEFDPNIKKKFTVS